MAGYEILQFADMVRDRRRLAANVELIRRRVTPDSVVADVGCGPGLFALMAAQQGARMVYAIDRNPAVDVVPLLAAANGLSDRVIALRGDVRDLDVPEQPDLVLADLRGVLPTHLDGLSVTADIIELVVAPGGHLQSVRDDLMASLAVWPRPREMARNWEGHGLDLSELVRLTTAELGRAVLQPSDVRSTATIWDRVDYTDVDDLRRRGRAGEGEVRATHDGEAHAVMLWFRAELLDGITYDTAPGEEPTTYGQWMLPLGEPLPIAEGEILQVAVSIDRLAGRDMFRWRVEGAAGVRQRTSLDAIPLSPVPATRIPPRPRSADNAELS